MKKSRITLPTIGFTGLLLVIILTHCSQGYSDIRAVKKASSDLGAMYNKTVEEVVQDIVGVLGTAKWSSFKPDGNFSDEVRVVEVNITKKDTLVYNTIRIQFIYNKSTGYVKQGAITVNGRECSLMQWWAYYTNILLLNSGAFNKESTNSQSNKSGRVETAQVESQDVGEENKLLVDILDRPDSNSYFQYISNEWMNISKGLNYGAKHPIKEKTCIRETISRIIVEFRNNKTLIYEIVKVTPYKIGINYTVEINGKRKMLTKCKDTNGSFSFSIENEWMANKIFEAMPAGID